MKRILITNDDGIEAPGIIRLAAAARALGEVTVIAPESERSALSHSITIREPVDLVPRVFPVPGVTAWVCSGTPSDCVRIGLLWLLPQKPDLVLSGINNGWNIAGDIQYSATVGAAMEAARHSVPAIALSEPYNGDHTVTDRFLSRILVDLQDEQPGPGIVLNVNFPADPCHGILAGRTVSAGSMHRALYRLMEKFPDGTLRLKADSVPDEVCETGTDFQAVLDGFISIGVVKNIG